MPIPDAGILLLPVLRMVAEGKSVEQARERARVEFRLTSKELAKRQKNGVPVLNNRVAWALAYLVMGKAIARRGAGAYGVTPIGQAILRRNPSELRIKDLR